MLTEQVIIITNFFLKSVSIMKSWFVPITDVYAALLLFRYSNIYVLLVNASLKLYYKRVEFSLRPYPMCSFSVREALDHYFS